MQVKIIELKPIKESTADFDQLEKRIKDLFKRLIYFPVLRELGEPRTVVANALGDYDALLESLHKGTITFSRGVFSGRFNAQTSKELRSFGAKWKGGVYRLTQASLPPELRSAIAASELRFKARINRIDRKLAQILPEEIAGQLKSVDLFDRTLWRTNQDFKASVKGITIAPDLTPYMRKRISLEWQNNMQLWIEDFTKTEILKLRTDIKKAAFSGTRYQSAVKTIQDSYGVSASKAKFLARQETSLLMTKFKQSRYQEAGIDEYKWGCVSGTKNHPVRPSHKRLEGKVFRWDDPPITTEPGTPTRRCNPGQDYNCRCFARPIVRFKKDDS